MFCPMSMFCMAVTIKCSVPSLCYAWLTRLLPYIGLSHVCVLYGCYNTVFCPIFVLCMTYVTVTMKWSVPCLCTVWLIQYSVLSHLCVMHDLRDCYNAVVCPMSVTATIQWSVPCLCTVWLLQYSVLSHVCVLYGCNNTVFCPIFVLCMTVTIQWSVPCLCFVWLTLSQQCSVLSHACVLSDWHGCYNVLSHVSRSKLQLQCTSRTITVTLISSFFVLYSIILAVSIYFWVVWAQTCFRCWHRAMIHEYSFCLFLQRTKYSFQQKRRHSGITIHFHQWNAKGERYCFQKNCNVFLVL